ncbi:MAG: RagB/SusD family nutrient uptake outer membrane protein [Bacteroidetes bacterium]|nr:MAG: RagB/SusD family nutrient uptake outer membrane protein [Bacteroidota bacterium]
MKKSIGIVSLMAMLLTTFQSCKKQLDIPSRNSLDASLVLVNKAGINAALNSVYSVLKSERLYGRDLFSVPEAMADVAFANGRSSRLLGENRNNALSNMANWGTSYGALNEINLILEALPGIADASAAEKAIFEGELKFLRALYHFDLVKSYAYIPTFTVPSQDRGGIVLSLRGFNNPDSAKAYLPRRASVAECYNQIISDLYASSSLLSNTHKGLNYANRRAAMTLASRVALYEGNWARSDSFATAAIAATGIGTMTTTANYNTAWRSKDHPEAIFQVWYASLAENLGVNTSLAATHTTLASLGGFAGVRQGQGDLVPNATLMGWLGITGFPGTLVTSNNPPPTLTYTADVRNTLFEWGANASGRYVECTKWMGKAGGPNWDNTVVFRVPELYLNRAEARYRSGNESGAWADLNFIRTNRIVGFTVPVTPLTGQALLDEILRQRAIEFAFEGYRFFDLKRYGLTITKSNPAVSLPATDFRLLPRIPVSEVDGNPNMVQNFGY